MVDVVLKMTLGLFVSKARSSLSEKLKDGGLNSQQLRGLIMSNLQDIKTKLAGLARSNLLTSASNVEEGLRFLDALLLDKPNTPTLPLQEDDKKVVENPDVAGKLEQASSSGKDSSLNVDATFDVFALDKPNTPTLPLRNIRRRLLPQKWKVAKAARNLGQASSSGKDSHLDIDVARALTEALKKIKINSSDNFVSAMKLFENANTEATKAFHNEALSLEDRVLATKLRVQSRLLLSLENPSLANQPCRLYLEELHGLSSIVEMFHNELEGGMLSFLNKEKRHELVLSVSAINVVVFNFLKIFTKARISLYEWPNLKRGPYNPLILEKTICVELQNFGVEIPGLYPDIYGMIRSVTVNEDGHLFLGTRSSIDSIHIQKVTINEVKTVEFSYLRSFRYRHVFEVAIDSYDNMYVLADECCSASETFSLDPRPSSLYAFDSEGVRTGYCRPGFCRRHKALAPTPDGFVIVSNNTSACTDEVAFYQNNGGKIQRTSGFQSKMWKRLLITVTSKYQVIVVEKRGFRVRVYEKDGRVIREFELYGGKDESCFSVAFNHLTEEVVFVTRVGNWYFLSSYVIESGERRHCTRLTLFDKIKPEDLQRYFRVPEAPHLTSHWKGPMALVSEEYILYIQ